MPVTRERRKVHCSFCREEAKAKRARGEEGLDYIYVGHSSESSSPE